MLVSAKLCMWNVHDRITTKPALSTLIRQIDSLIVCPGNPDSHFLALADARKGIFHSPSKGAVAFRFIFPCYV